MKKRPLLIFLISLTSILIFVCAFKIIVILNEYARAEQIYDEINAEVLQPVDHDTSVPDNNSNIISADDLDISVDFDYLKTLNPDIIAWIYIPDTNISYPITQYTDNEYYLTIASTGEKSSAGSIFLDYRNNIDFSDKNSIIYGHNMKNNSMFGALDMYKDADYLENHQYIYIFIENYIYKYQVFSASVIDATIEYYRVSFTDEEDYAMYLAQSVHNSIIKPNTKPSPSQNIITLSTCTASRKNRFIVQAFLCD